MLEQHVQQFVKAHHSAAPGNEVHYIDRYMNAVGHDYGDEYRADGVNVDDLLLDDCRAYVKQHLTGDDLVTVMADKCLEDVRAHCRVYFKELPSSSDAPARAFDQPLTAEEAYGDQGLMESLKKAFEEEPAEMGEVVEIAEVTEPSKGGESKSPRTENLRAKYGDIDITYLISERRGIDEEDERPYALIQDATMLKYAVARNLRQSGVLERFKMEVVTQKKRGAWAIKHVGADESAYYVKEKLPGGDVRRPLQLDDLPAKIKDAALIKAALAHTRNSAELHAFAPQRIWNVMVGVSAKRRLLTFYRAPILKDIDCLSYIKKITDPTGRRYRENHPAYAEYFMKKVIKEVKNFTLPMRGAVLLEALKQADIPLSRCLSSSVDHIGSEKCYRPEYNKTRLYIMQPC